MTLMDFFAHDRFAADAGVRLTCIRSGHAEAEMEVTERVLNASGYVQGGAIFTLADLTFAAAVNTQSPLAVSVNANIVFISNVREGKLVAVADVAHEHHRLPCAQVRITDGTGRLIALFSSSAYRIAKATTGAEGLM